MSPNRYTDRELLCELRDLAGRIERSPTALDTDQKGEFATRTYQLRFGSFWKAVVAAGLPPRDKTPVSDSGFDELHATTLGRPKPSHKLVGLLAMFTPLPRNLLTQISESWVHDRTYSDPILRVPAEVTPSSKKWEFKLLSEFTASDGKTRETHLPGLLNWYVSTRELPVSPRKHTLSDHLNEIARQSELPKRQLVERTLYDGSRDMIPKVTFDDLRMTLGTKIARDEAPKRRIRRHLGFEHTNMRADVEDIFLWNYVHNGHEHPDYEPPDVVLDPVH